MRESILEQHIFVKEAKEIMDNIDKSTFLNIILDSLNKAMKAVLLSKLNALNILGSTVVSLGKSTSNFIKNEIHIIKRNRGSYIDTITPRLKNISIDTRDNIQQLINDKINKFKGLSLNAKQDLILSGLLWVGTILVIGGGTDFEGGAPDLDTKIGGIDNHRNAFSHTILLD